MADGRVILSSLRSEVDLNDYRKLHWEGSFEEYLDIVLERPEVTRTAYQRLYDMILSHGTEEVVVNKEKVLRYKFFEDRDNLGQDAIFGLEKTLSNLINILKSAANRYGTERQERGKGGAGVQMPAALLGVVRG